MTSFTLNHFALLIQISLDKMHRLSMLALFQVRTDTFVPEYDTKRFRITLSQFASRVLPVVFSIYPQISRSTPFWTWMMDKFYLWDFWNLNLTCSDKLITTFYNNNNNNSSNNNNNNNNDNDNYFLLRRVITKFIECLSV